MVPVLCILQALCAGVGTMVNGFAAFVVVYQDKWRIGNYRVSLFYYCVTSTVHCFLLTIFPSVDFVSNHTSVTVGFSWLYQNNIIVFFGLRLLSLCNYVWIFIIMLLFFHRYIVMVHAKFAHNLNYGEAPAYYIVFGVLFVAALSTLCSVGFCFDSIPSEDVIAALNQTFPDYRAPLEGMKVIVFETNTLASLPGMTYILVQFFLLFCIPFIILYFYITTRYKISQISYMKYHVKRINGALLQALVFQTIILVIFVIIPALTYVFLMISGRNLPLAKYSPIWSLLFASAKLGDGLIILHMKQYRDAINGFFKVSPTAVVTISGSIQESATTITDSFTRVCRNRPSNYIAQA